MSIFLETMQALTTGDPVFAGLADEDFETWISLAVVEVNTTRWSSLYVQAVALLAAHKYSMGPGRAGMGGASVGGSVVARRARNWELRFQATSGGDVGNESLMQTSYGLEFLRLRAQTRGPSIITPSLG